MALKTKMVKWIVALLTLALTGMTALQASLLSGAMELKESSFQRNVMSAIGSVSESLTVGEASNIFLTTGFPDSSQLDGAIVAMFSADTVVDMGAGGLVNGGDELLAPLRVYGDTVRYKVAFPQRVKLTKRLPDNLVDTVLVDSFHPSGDYEIVVEGGGGDLGSYTWKSEGGGAKIFHERAHISKDISQLRISGELSSDSGKMRIVAEVMKNYMNAEFVSIEERLDSINVDSVVESALTQAGIDLDFAYAIYSEPSDTPVVISDSSYKDELAESDFRVRLFQQDVFAPPTHLSLFFPDRRMFLWGQMTPMLGATAILTLLIVGAFGLSIRSLNRQRRVSELMVEFINNMTHEFKTPISTIALASEAIDRDEVAKNPEQILRFNKMIKSEAARMRGQAERILQMAALEERTLELVPAEVDLHEILDDAIRAIDLRVSGSQGIIERDFRATDSLLQADKIHLLNIAHNLLDNASKYSEGPPKIIVRTFDSDRGIGFRIEDQGIGIDPQNQKQVFEKYYRAPTGNVHNVKGFGLGLSYVKLIVEQHHGEITLHSIQGEKTEVEIILPRKHERGQTS